MAYTETSIRNFLKKNEIQPESIRYILRCNNETCFHMLDNRIISTLIPLNHFQSYFSEDDFTRINKSALISNRQVVNVNKGIYLMTDGISLEGRHHSIKKHTEFMRNLVKEQNEKLNIRSLEQLKNRLAVFDDLPIPYCVVQLVFDVYGKTTSLIFRYCNKMMTLMENQPVSSFLNHSFYEVFANYPPDEWLAKLGNISRNGGIETFHVFNKQYGGFLYIVCYQLTADCCGCIFIPHGWINVLENLNLEPVSSKAEADKRKNECNKNAV